MPFKWIPFTEFGGGLNNTQSATEIADNELSELLNFEFTASDHLMARHGFVKYNISPDFSSRVTSIFNFITAADVSHIVLTTGSSLYKNTAGVFSSIKGALTLPSDTYWQWKTFNNLAIGVNQDIVGDDTIKWSGTGNAAVLALTGIAGTPVGAYTLEVFNSRLWMVFSSHPNRLYYSTLGDPEDWSTSGGFIEIGYNDGDRIEGIIAHRKKLFILKRLRTYVLNTEIGGVINTNPAGWSVDKLSNVGCRSRFSIQVLLDDLIFLSDEGIVSIGAVQQYGDFETTVLSRKITGLTGLNPAINTFCSEIMTPKSLYMIAVPSISTNVVNDTLYILDYKRILDKTLRWTKFTSKFINISSLSVCLVSGKKTLFLGGDSSNFPLCTWSDTVFNDDNQVVTKRVRTKAYAFGNNIERKQINEVALGVSFTDTALAATLRIRFDQDESKSNSFPISINNNSIGATWDLETWSSGVFATQELNNQLLHFKVKGDGGNRGRNAQVVFENAQLNQDPIITDLGFEAELLSVENA